ncbi:PiggyBac transposable element-derived protein 4 [Amphibalanus amphitrite]|uniref:PiggyBac transposable element-derived protein 4 n=1 Tax=Amphibalanus amphitrite TaxID=1232801 RepID=A0A6A4V9N3_AMPAM|nr:PiggyBac transposable element-derived protein 4 [Amphibalanus amphitrite]
MYMPSKAGKYGLLLRTVADANYRYMWKLWPYSGRPTEPERSPPATYFESVPEMVKYMVEDVAGTGRNITMDRYFTSVPLAEDLLADQLTIVGTCNKRRQLLPKELTEASGREVDSSIFCFRNDVTLVSQCTKPGKLVLAVSTQHRGPCVDSRTKKPEIVLYYKASKGAWT